MNKKLFRFLLFIFAFLLSSVGCGGASDSEYASVTLTGGSGKASIESPCKISTRDGKAWARIIWSSPNYDYMIVGGETYYPVNKEGNSEFEIPVELDEDMQVQADTTAMSTPHLIDYTLRVSLSENDTDKEPADDAKAQSGYELSPPKLSGAEYISTDTNDYARCFAIHRYSKGIIVISVDDGRNYLLLPAGEEISDYEGKDHIIIHRPPENIYLAASGAMCHFDAIGAADRIRLSGLKADSWYIDAARKAMEAQDIIYGGKYSAPDYEKMVMEDVGLAIESTMILHTPKVLDKLKRLEIPTLIDRSSYEQEPLGRCEWVKVYGVICDKEAEAAGAFEEQKRLLGSLQSDRASGRRVAVFSINSNHQIVTRPKNDYFAKMIEQGGGKYLAPEYGDGDGDLRSQITVSMEAFYDYAAEADILIYNGAIENAPDSIEALLDTDAIFSDFKALKNENIWYTDRSLYQYADRTGTIIDNLYRVISEGEEETEFFHRLKHEE